MKKFYITPVLFLFGMAVFAQENNQGTVTYEQVVKLEIKLEGDASQFASMMPKERKSKKTLIFNQEASVYKNLKNEGNEPMDMEQGGTRVMIKMDEPDNITFTDLKNNTQVEQREFMTRMFLIDGSTEMKWKFTGNQKTILDYPCQEAILEGADEKTSVWFTPAIPVSAGPGKFGGLPGLILAVDIKDGDNVTTATKVDFSPIDISLLEKPNKGKKVTREEYEKIVADKMKEMGATPGSGGSHMMIRIGK
jgi:GLPGLI family protein